MRTIIAWLLRDIIEHWRTTNVELHRIANASERIAVTLEKQSQATGLDLKLEKPIPK